MTQHRSDDMGTDSNHRPSWRPCSEGPIRAIQRTPSGTVALDGSPPWTASSHEESERTPSLGLRQDAAMSESSGDRDEEVTVRLEWDAAADAGYLSLTDIKDGDAVSQRIVESPVKGLGEVILDFDREGRLLGVEFLGRRLLPPGLAPQQQP